MSQEQQKKKRPRIKVKKADVKPVWKSFLPKEEITNLEVKK